MNDPITWGDLMAFLVACLVIYLIFGTVFTPAVAVGALFGHLLFKRYH